MDVIGELLRAGLLTQIGEEEHRVEMLRSATTALAGSFASDLRASLPHAVIAGVDERTPVSSAPMVAADDALLHEWSTYRNAFPEPPAEILRAILVGAAAEAAEDDASLRAAGWYTLRTALEALPTSRWSVPLNKLISVWDEAVWQETSESWSSPPISPRVRMPSVEKIDSNRIAVSTSARERAQELQDSGNWQVFAQSLQTTYSEHIESLVSVSEKLAGEVAGRANESLRNFASELGSKLRDVLSSQEQAIESIRLRGELLWWKESAYSLSRRTGYSRLAPADACLAAAFDLHLLMPDVAPLSAEHLLFELVTRVSAENKVSIAELHNVSFDFSLDAPNGDPSLILDAIQEGTTTPLFESGQQLEAGRAAVLVFRDLQTLRIISNESQ